MQIIKRYGTLRYYQTHIGRFSETMLSRPESCHTHSLAWAAMQSYCAKQRSLEMSRLRVFLHGGERINRMALLYAPQPLAFPSSNIPAKLVYPLPAGLHFNLEDLRFKGEMQKVYQQVDSYALPRALHAYYTGEENSVQRGENFLWLSRPLWDRHRRYLLRLAKRLLLRRGVQSDLGEIFVRALEQSQNHRLRSRLEYFHPQGNALLGLQSQMLKRYGEIFSHALGPFGLPLLRERAFPGLQDARRMRRRRTKLRTFLSSLSAADMRPRFASSVVLPSISMLARPQQLSFFNLLLLLSRQALRHSWRRRRGLGLLHRTVLKSGRISWELTAAHIFWPLRRRSFFGVSLYASFVPYSGFPRVGLTKESKTLRADRLLRAFPFLFSRTLEEGH